MALLIFTLGTIICVILAYFLAFKAEPEANLRSETTAENIESKIGPWSKDSGAIEVNRVTVPNTLFAYGLDRGDDAPVTIGRFKSTPQFLVFQIAISLGAEANKAMAALSPLQQATFQAKVRADLSKTRAEQWSFNDSFEKLFIRKGVAIIGLTEKSFISAIADIAGQAQAAADTLFADYSEIIPTEMTGRSVAVTPDNVEQLLEEWAKTISAHISKLPSDPDWYFGYSFAFSDNNPNCVLRFRQKEAEDQLAFRVNIPLHTVSANYRKLSRNDQEALVSELESNWQSYDIPAEIQPPFHQVVIMRLVPINQMNGVRLSDELLKIHYEGCFVNKTVNDFLNHYSNQEVLPNYYKYRLLDNNEAKRIAGGLLIGVRPKTFVDSVQHDQTSLSRVWDTRSVFVEAECNTVKGRTANSPKEVKQGAVSISLPENPSPDLVRALVTLCSSLNVHVDYRYESSKANEIGILFGPP